MVAMINTMRKTTKRITIAKVTVRTTNHNNQKQIGVGP